MSIWFPSQECQKSGANTGNTQKKVTKIPSRGSVGQSEYKVECDMQVMRICKRRGKNQYTNYEVRNISVSDWPKLQVQAEVSRSDFPQTHNCVCWTPTLALMTVIVCNRVCSLNKQLD